MSFVPLKSVFCDVSARKYSTIEANQFWMNLAAQEQKRIVHVIIKGYTWNRDGWAKSSGGNCIYAFSS